MKQKKNKAFVQQHLKKQQIKQQGLALISIVLFTALVLASIVGITATMALTAKRTTTDQMMILRAQYAAESGLSLAKLRLGELEDVVNLAKYPSFLTSLDIHALDFCGLTTYTNNPTPSGDWTNTQRINGFELCNATALGGASNTANRLSILNDYITVTDMKSIGIEIPPSQYWDELFSSTLTSSQILQANSEGTVRFEIDYNMLPKSVRLMQDQLSMRFVFGLGNVVARGIIENPQGEILATRKLEIQPNATELYLEVSKPSFAQYGYFADTRMIGTSQIYFKDGNNIGGRVHINKNVAFSASTTTGGPRFSGKFSTTDPSIVWGNNSQIVNEDLMFLGGSEFGAQYISLPVNNHIQRDKALGVNGITTNDEICTALNLKVDATPEGCQAGATTTTPTIIADGIYFVKGNGDNTPNATGGLYDLIAPLFGWPASVEFFGGIYVQGDVDNIVLSIDPADKNQIIVIEHRNGTAFEFKQKNGVWRVTDLVAGTGSTQEISGSFNGLIFVDGKVGCNDRRGTSVSVYDTDPRAAIKALYTNGNPMCSSSDNGLKGDGTNTPDIQEDFMITVTATGDINIKDDITYQSRPECASTPEDTFNVLGVFTPGTLPVKPGQPSGNILVDGPDQRHLNIHGAFMASKVDHGFGTLDYAGHYRGNDSTTGNEVDIVLHGSVVHHTDQAVGTFNPSTGKNKTGYGRNWEFDCRLANGFAPPFFPTQNEWDKLTSFNGLNNRSTWRLK